MNEGHCRLSSLPIADCQLPIGIVAIANWFGEE